jgi:hypothetical protein
MAPLVPRFPVYIPSKSRAQTALTPRALDRLGVPWRMIVEAQQLDDYAAQYPRDRLLVLPPEYQLGYDPCDGLGSSRPMGPGPARNFALDHSVSEGHAWHWVMDDNIRYFGRLNENKRMLSGDGMIFAAMEDFVLRYENIGEAGPDYWFFVKARTRQAHPFVLNRRVFSCNLIRNDTGIRWRGRYNEDLDLAYQFLEAGWCTVVFRTFLQHKTVTQAMAGGNTEAFYATEGTLHKSQLAVKMHPDDVRLHYRFGRWHHIADWSKWENMGLIRRADYAPSDASKYATRVVERPKQ